MSESVDGIKSQYGIWFCAEQLCISNTIMDFMVLCMTYATGTAIVNSEQNNMRWRTGVRVCCGRMDGWECMGWMRRMNNGKSEKLRGRERWSWKIATRKSGFFFLLFHIVSIAPHYVHSQMTLKLSFTENFFIMLYHILLLHFLFIQFICSFVHLLVDTLTVWTFLMHANAYHTKMSVCV